MTHTDQSAFVKRGFILSVIRSVVQKFRLISIKIKSHGEFSYSRDFYIGKGSTIYIPSKAFIDDRVAIGAYFFCQTDIDIGCDCLISSKVSFVGNDHDLEGSESMYYSGRTAPSKVTLQGNNFIGFGTTILGNVNIGHGAIIGAHSLVLNDIPDNAIAVGTPAKVIRYKS